MIHRTPDIREWSARAGEDSVAQRHLSVQSAEETQVSRSRPSRQVQTLLSGDATHPTQVGTSAVIIVTITIIHPPHTRSLAFVSESPM